MSREEQGQEQSGRTDAIVAAIAKQREEAEAEGQTFTGLTDRNGRNKINKQSEPLIVWQTWSSSVAVGSTLICDIGIANPTASKKQRLFVQLLVGTPTYPAPPGPPWADLSHVLIDPRFPRLTLPRFDGLSLDSGEVRSLSFAFQTPLSVERSNYFAHALLIHAGWHDGGQHLDRSLFLFELV